MRFFIINRQFRFDPQARTLERLEEDKNTVFLHAPASECLVLLLTHNGETLSHRFLSDEVWKKRGNYVSMNTLYQNIAAIRRCMKSVGMDENALKTVPKIGFQFNAALIEEEGVLPEMAADPSDTANSTSVVQEESETIPVALPHLKESLHHSAGISLRFYIVFGLVLSGVFVFGCYVLFKELGPRQSFYARYNPLGQIDQCELYSSSSAKQKSVDVFTALMRTGKLTCPAGGKAYLTFNANYHLSSVVVCDTDIAKNNVTCASVYYAGDINENL